MRHNAATSRDERARVDESGSGRRRADVLLDHIRTAKGPVSALTLHQITGWPYHTVTARLGDLRDRGVIVDSDEDSKLCPFVAEVHSCCDGTGKPSKRKTYAIVKITATQLAFPAA